ncbi:MAG TPA: TraR/DksA C4-type zinc finger protein [Pirellulales bacterium]|nr:TraR/DksA C4-type zinc finger protein [Pirellulales bacterium]
MDATLSASQLDHFRTLLRAMRDRLSTRVNETEESLHQQLNAPGEITNIPTHPADRDVEGLDASVAIAQNEETMLEQVVAALARVEAGTYGVCPICGGAIPTERLEAIPYATTCVECAAKSDADHAPETPPRGEPRLPR